ncbi:hypothetical protein [Methylobacterium indicum]|uniref:Uncharacterized protein n=1 Tax=Methylobacterium indicum TaxID=1775910 RepID=A0A8H8WUB0_9HYPH|nr:hypothetical protein [Methylobacterium indicum]BCM84420.1 hypothetical protein mvi_28810 [Methylobacterium indicum]
MVQMPRRVSLGDGAAPRHPEHDRPDEAEGVARALYVVAPLRQHPVGAVAVLAAAAMVTINHLRDVAQPGAAGREGGMVESRTAIQ